MVLIPWAIPTVVASQMWRFIFNDRYGLVNFMLFGADTSSYLAPLADPHLALAAIMIAEIWKTTPFAALILLAGLQSIADELYEAASVDGATSLAEIPPCHVAFDQAGVAFGVVVSHHRFSTRVRLVYVMTQGGPADATNVLQFYGYKKTFAEGMIGYGSAIAVTVFLLSLTLALVYLHLLRASRWKEAGL